ncbi:MAG: SusC/RagA family TonB-linked outer membrane protein [bacterium]
MRSKIFFTFLLCLVLVPCASWAQEAVISGKITDEAGESLPGANVLIQLTQLGAATDINGEYKFTVPASAVRGQQVSLEARFIGYRTKVEKITLTPGSHSMNFSLAVDALQMDAIIVTGVVDETPRAKLAFSVGRVSQEALERVPARSVEASLRGKIAGVRIVRGSGEPGTDASVLLRAPTSINANGRSQDPLYIVDGVIIDPSVAGSPLSDINAEDIESIEVVKGAAGASLYGSRAANGVVNITTSRGRGLALNQTRIRIRNEFGFNDNIKDYPLNRSHWFRIHEGTDDYTDANGVRVTPGDFIDGQGNFIDPRLGGVRVGDRYTGNYDPDNPDPQRVGQMFFSDKPYKWISTGDVVVDENLNPVLDPATGQPVGLQRIEGKFIDNFNQFFDPGTFVSNSVSMSRNMENTNFSISLSNRKEDGIVEGLKGYERQTVRLAVDHKFRKDLSITVSGFFSNVARDDVSTGSGSTFFGLAFIAADADLRARHLPVGTLTSIYNAQTGFPNGIPLDIGGELFIEPDPYAPRDNPIYETTERIRENNSTRFMGGATATYQPVDWFKIDANFSYDRSNREFNLFNHVGYQDPFDTEIALGQFTKFPSFDEAINGSVTAAFQRSFLNNELTIRTKARGLFEKSELQNTFVEGNDFIVRGVRDLNVANPLKTNINSLQTEVRSEGFSVITGLDYKDRYIADFLVRRDGSSLFGPDERWQTYFRGSGAYRLSQEPWWFTDKIQEFKIRGSYGTAGGRPNFFARFETWSVSQGQVSKSTLGNRNLKPEFAKEFEIGIDMTFLNKFSLELTRAESTVEDQLLEVPLASYQGYTTQWRNAATLETSTWEISLQGALLQTRDMSLSLGFNLDRTRQTISELNVPAYNWGPPFQGPDIFRIEEGADFGAIFGTRYVQDVQDLLPQGITQDELSQFDVNDEGWVVWVGDGNTFRDGISKQLWGTETTLSNGDIYEWGMVVPFEDEEGTNQFIVGSTVPDFNWSFFTNFDWKGFSVYGLLDAQVGGDVYSLTEQWGYGIEARSAVVDQTGKPDGLKKPIRYYRTSQDHGNNFVFDGSFVKLRELSVMYSFNRNQLKGLFGGILQKVSFGIVGRNLFSLDNYDRGTDPEVGIRGGRTDGGSAAVARFDAFNYPNFRTFTGVLEIEL